MSAFPLDINLVVPVTKQVLQGYMEKPVKIEGKIYDWKTWGQQVMNYAGQTIGILPIDEFERALDDRFVSIATQVEMKANIPQGQILGALLLTN